MKFSSLHYLAVLVIASAFLILVFVIYLMTWPPQILVPNIQPYKSITKTVTVGGDYVYETNACKYANTLALVQRTLVIGDTSYLLSDPIGYLTSGCTKKNVVVKLPPATITGTAHLDLRIVYQVNFLRTVIYNLQTESFEVK